ncbi:MAG: hypothetical protein HZB35_05365 [Nitrospirae bacterium]|nr:hypothetical protein [Nitrospirota bacterium]
MSHPERLRRHHTLPSWTCAVAGTFVAGLSVLTPASAAGEDGPFDQVTTHVRRQIAADKAYFAEADLCTNWFYRRYRPQFPPAATGIAWPLSDEEARCRAKYPKGLEEARADFSRTQSALSISFTFFELVLVGDRNDDHQYSAAELNDLLDSFGPAVTPSPSPETPITALVARFEAIHGSGDLELIMRSLSALFDKGYRFTKQDEAALQLVMG